MFDVVVLDMLSLYPHEDEEEEKNTPIIHFPLFLVAAVANSMLILKVG